MAPFLRVTSIVLGLSVLAVVGTKENLELKDICVGSSYKSIKEVGQGAVLEVGPNNIPAWNPCVMRVETCAHCKIVIQPYGQDFSLLGCNRDYDITGKSCPAGCQYLYIFDQFYKNQTMGFYKDSSVTSWNLPFMSESSVVFVGFCHGNSPLNRSIQLRYTIQEKEEHYRGSSDMGTSGEITSPFFPDLYSLNSEYYTYQIQSNNQDDLIYIIFTDWDISPTSGVFVEWAGTEAFYRYTSDRPVIMARSHKVKIVFDTGYEYQHGVLRSNMGFRLKYRYINTNVDTVPVPSTNCGENSFSGGGKLELDTSTTVNYKYYDCVWVVRTTPGYTHTLLNIIKFNIGTSGHDSDDYIEIYGGLSSKGRFLKRFRSGETITNWQYKDTQGFYIHLFGKFGLLDMVQLTYVSLNMEELCSSSNNLWRCNNGYCISSKYKCDGVDHCGDNSDEQYGCSGTGSPWRKSSQQTLAFSVVIPVVISVFLIIILFVLFLLVRRYRRAQREVIRRASEGLPSISEDLSQPHGRRRRRRHRGVIGEDLPPAYEEAIRSPPMYPDISLDPPGPGHWMLPKPPPYSESLGTPVGPPVPPCFGVVEEVSTECALASNSSDSSESEQWDGPRNHHLTDDSSDASPIPRVRTTHSYSTSYSSDSSMENTHTPRHVRFPVTEIESTDQIPVGRAPSTQEGDGLTELPIRQLLIPGTEVISGETDRHRPTERQTNPHLQNPQIEGQTEPHRPDVLTQRGRSRNQPTERPTDRVHRNRQTDRHRHNVLTERGADRHFQDQPRDRQTDRRDEVRRNLFKTSSSSAHNKTQNKSQNKSSHDEHNKHKFLPTKLGANPIQKLPDHQKGKKRPQREDVVNPTQALHNQPGGRPSQYHTSMPNIADPPALPRPGFQSLSNFSSAGAIQEATDMSGNIQPKHRQYAKSLENISQVAGSQALRPFHFDSDPDPVGRSRQRDGGSRNSWSPRETGQSRLCDDNPGTSREALCGDSSSNTRFQSGEFNTSLGCVNAAFCESPTREIPPILISGQGSANLPQSVTDMRVNSSDSSGSRSRVRQQPHISLRSEPVDNDENECYA